MDYTPNQSALDKVFAEIAAKIEALDAELRREYSGRPVDEIVGPAAEAFRHMGVLSLSDDWIYEYAAAVSAGEPFTLDLG